MDTLLWILQALLAAIFLITGMTKLTQPREKMAAGFMTWAERVSDRQFRAIGLSEVLGAVGLILPAALEIAPVLTALAAVGLVLTMVGALLTHLRLGETGRIAAPVILLLVLVFVAIERFGPHSF